MFEHAGAGGDFIQGIQIFRSIGAVKHKRVHIEVSYLGLLWDSPHFSVGAKLAFENGFFQYYDARSTAVIQVDLVAVAVTD